MRPVCEVAIIGGGLSGLAIADALHRAGRDWVLLEARDRLGGRILSQSAPGAPDGAQRYDLGPAWAWPHNSRLLGLAERLGVPVFEQYATGRLVFEDGAGRVRRDLDFQPMAGALRLTGGMRALTDGLAAGLPADRMHISTAVRRVAHRDNGQLIEDSGGKPILLTKNVILALPPRLIDGISFDPSLPAEVAQALSGIPTWMAGHAKAVALYDRPFWREAGLSGSAMSHRGPLAEIHDASPAAGGEGALFGFIGILADARAAHRTELESAIISQLTHLFGPCATNPLAVMLQDWAAEAETAVEADRNPPAGHPAYGTAPPLAALAARGLHVAGSEVAAQDGGFLEGALVAAEAAAAALGGGTRRSLTA
ncbi:MAG: FAD-dependent oxidoreductase [Pseudomonadota bacterium]